MKTARPCKQLFHSAAATGAGLAGLAAFFFEALQARCSSERQRSRISSKRWFYGIETGVDRIEARVHSTFQPADFSVYAAHLGIHASVHQIDYQREHGGVEQNRHAGR